MRKMIFKSFAKNLFGVKYERLTRNLFTCLIVFWGLHIADLKVQISPFIFYLMTGAFTAGVMWQALGSEEQAAQMQNLFMMPFQRREFVFSYIAALGAYTLVTKTAMLLSVLLAVSDWKPAIIPGSILWSVNAVLMAAVIYSFKKHWYAGVFWTIAVAAAVLFLGNQPWFLLIIIANIVFAVMLLQKADGYSFYLQKDENSHLIKGRPRDSVWRYLFRYLIRHKNYLLNTAVMWCAACVLPLFFRQMESMSVAPIGFAILSLNTPVCILLSCDPDLEQAVRFLPGQMKSFCVPYCLFIFLCNITADVIFLCSMQFQKGGVDFPVIAAALFFALQSAIGSVLLEWFYPVRGWKIESDLWHHPRKYVVPVIMLLLAGAVGIFPILIPGLILMLMVESILLFLYCQKCGA
ncbi:hypothetical protein E5329_16130 [Petralouisia muris]|uniref:Uncharacterized protein n=1 Tax=Petralouisia muris TaxID=3032872 RepID=A0AC61RTY6_9FIRM|nr:hypothetical protein [Petralouisia muris]TGY95190.1 hypothetical protein E5329_16130 [Petralouisia muris]